MRTKLDIYVFISRWIFFAFACKRAYQFFVKFMNSVCILCSMKKKTPTFSIA